MLRSTTVVLMHVVGERAPGFTRSYVPRASHVIEATSFQPMMADTNIGEQTQANHPRQAIRNATPPRDKNRRGRNFSNLSGATRSVKSRGTMEGHSRFARLNHPPPVDVHDYIVITWQLARGARKPASLRGSPGAAKIKNAASTNLSPVVDSGLRASPPGDTRGLKRVSRSFPAPSSGINSTIIWRRNGGCRFHTTPVALSALTDSTGLFGIVSSGLHCVSYLPRGNKSCSR